MKLIDVHSHLQFSAFEVDREEIIKKAFEAGIGIINAGTNKENSLAAVELAKKYSQNLWAAIGRHPTEKENFDYEFYKNLAKDKKVVAIGECGLDYYRIEDRGLRIEKKIKIKQQEIFIKHIKLANEVGKPLMIHCREAFDDLIKILNSQSSILNPFPGVLHFFTGSLKDAKKLLEMGFYFTFGGLITFNRDFDEIIRFIPLERILLETDAPYVAPVSYRGKRNEPVYIIETAQKMAKIKNVSFEKVCEQTIQNTKLVFDIS